MLSKLSAKLKQLVRRVEKKPQQPSGAKNVNVPYDVAQIDRDAPASSFLQAKLSEPTPDPMDANHRDDLTALNLDKALKEMPLKERYFPKRDQPQTHDSLKQQSVPQLELPADDQVSSGSLQDTSVGQAERIVDLAKRSYASTSLINALERPDQELPVTTVEAYMSAPEETLEAFRRLDNLGDKTVQELDQLLRRYANSSDYRKRKCPGSLVVLVRNVNCSVRLFNAINSNENQLPVDTVQEYMRAPEHARQAFLRLSNLGRKSADELDKIVRDYALGSELRTALGGNQTSDDERSLNYDAMNAAESFFSGLRYPDELFEWSPPTRLANLLVLEREENASAFFDFLKTYKKTIARLFAQINCGRKSIEDLDKLVSQLIESRLEVYGFDTTLEPILRRLLRNQDMISDELKQIIELKNASLTSANDPYAAALEHVGLSDIVGQSISNLEKRQNDIIRRRYGVARSGSETLQEIADDYLVTRERIRQIEKKAKKKIATKRTVKFLASALERDDILGKLFIGRKLIVDSQISTASKSLSAEEYLAIDLAYGDLRSFLDSESVRTEAGWVQEHDLLLITQEPELLSGSLRQRIVEAIRASHLPIRLSELASAIPDYPVSNIKDELVECLDAKLQGDIVCAAPRLPRSVRCTLVLREAGHSMHCDEIRARIHEVFGKDEGIGQIGNTLAGLQEALIVARGTYDLYENLSLTEADLSHIRDQTYRHLEVVGGFISAKVLFSELFQGETERFGVEFHSYMLLGILQDDERFDTKRGLMVGLASKSGESEFRGLGEDVLIVLSEAGGSMTLVEIANELEGRRDVLSTSISIGLENSSDAVSVGRGRFDLTSRVVGDDAIQADLIFACAIILADGEKSVLALSELLNSVWGDIQTRPLKSFLKNRSIFKIERDIVSLVELPQSVANYIEARNNTPRDDVTGFIDLTALKAVLIASDTSDLSRLDPLLAAKSEDEDFSKQDEMLGKILGDFGIN